MTDEEITHLLRERGYIATPRKRVWWITNKKFYNGVYITRDGLERELQAGTLIEYIVQHMEAD